MARLLVGAKDSPFATPAKCLNRAHDICAGALFSEWGRFSTADLRPKCGESPVIDQFNLSLRGIKAEGRRASSCWKHAFGMTRPHAAAIWLGWAHRPDFVRVWPT
ncbi:hypothetical protein DZK27_08035 [Rhodobacteraceae bacterium 63075]|nr:hypothetical protein DZK27_08035 [Rhodobacteraceae bacterium 63075]